MLSSHDLYAIRLALEGRPEWRDNGASPIIKGQLERLTRQRGMLAAMLPNMYPEEIIEAIGQVDLSKPPTVAKPAAQTADYDVPDLPAYARLTPAQERDAEGAGQWEREFTSWAGRRANETPLLFHQAAGLSLAGTAIGRRLYAATHWGEDVHPNLYVMIVAISTYFHKTTSLRLVEKMLQRTIPHMILPEPGSPENLLAQLAGNLDLLENMHTRDKERYRKGLTRFAGQRLIVRDELSGLFRSMGKDYMAGMKERLMQMYDGSDELPVSTNTRGILIVRETALSIVGTTTPAGLSAAVTAADWRDGSLARFVLITPEPGFADRPIDVNDERPDALDTVIRTLHAKLPEPPDFSISEEKPERWAVTIRPYKHFLAYSKAMRSMTAGGTGLDDRLRALYGRHPVKALKVALTLAALDWASAGATGRPKVEDRHWFRAQQIAEAWRASAHRCLKDLSMSSYSEAETRVRNYLARFPDGATRTQLLNGTTLPKKALDEVLETLGEAGEVEVQQRKTGGRVAHIYKWGSM